MTESLAVDVAVVGGGPVGLATALYARRAALSVAVVEPRSTPVDKACGEGLMPGAVARLDALGVAPPGRAFSGITYIGDSGRAVGADFPAGHGLGVRRTTLHQALARAAADAGVAVVPSAAEQLTKRAGGVEVRAGSTTVRAGYLIAADGLHSRVRERLGLAAPARLPKRYGLRRHWRLAPWSEHVEVHWSPHAEAYVTPVADDLVGIAVLTAQRGRTYQSWLDDFPEIGLRLRGAEPASDVRGAGPLEQRTSRRTTGRVLLVGDAAGYLDALTGEGLGVGLRCAEAVVEAVLADDPTLYERRWREITEASWGLTEALVRATQLPVLRRRLVPAATRVPSIFRQAVATLA